MILDGSFLTHKCTFKCVNKEFAGFSSKEFHQNIDSYIRLIHIPDRPLRQIKLCKLNEQMHRNGLNSMSFILEYRIKAKDGSLVPVAEHGMLSATEQGDVSIHSVISLLSAGVEEPDKISRSREAVCAG